MQRTALITHSLNAYRGYTMSEAKSARINLEECIRARVPLVYCIRRDESASIVKIGTTRDIVTRLRQLGASFDDVLCLVHGGRREESIVHLRFHDARVTLGDEGQRGRTEHFRMTKALAAWINICRDDMGMQPLDLDSV